jgi:hypothetical protein
VDDVHKPPVNYPSDDRRFAGGIILRPSILLSVEPSYGYRLPSQQDASFNTTFTMSVISRSRNQAAAAIDDGGGLVFQIVPYVLPADRNGSIYGPTCEPLASTTSGNISVELSKDNSYYRSGMYVSITPAPTRDAPPANYSVWIDYDGKTQITWVYVDKGNKPKPAEATLRALNISGIFSWDSYGSYFGLFASKDRRLPSCQPVIYSWSMTVDRLSEPMPMDYGHDRRRGIGKGCSWSFWCLWFF